MNAGEIGLQLRIRSSADTSALGDATRSMTGFGDESKVAAGTLRELSMTGREANMVFSGLERGGLSGTMQAMRGMQMLARTLKVDFLELAPTIAAVAAPFLVAMKMMGDRVKENEADIAYMFKNSVSAAKLYQDTLEGLEKANAKMTEKMVKDFEDVQKAIAATSAALVDLRTHSDAVAKADSEAAVAKVDLEKQKALAAGKPEDRERISTEFEFRKQQIADEQKISELFSTKARAKEDERQGTKALMELDERRRLVQQKQGEAEGGAADLQARAAAGRAEFGEMPFVRDLDKRALAAKKAAEDLAKETEKQLEAIEKSEAEVQKTISAARTTLETLPAKTDALRMSFETEALERKQRILDATDPLKKDWEAAGGTVADITGKLGAAKEEGLRSTELNANSAKIEQLTRELSAAKTVEEAAKNKYESTFGALTKASNDAAKSTDHQSTLTKELSETMKEATGVIRQLSTTMAAVGSKISSGGSASGGGASDSKVGEALEEFFGDLDAKDSSMVHAIETAAQNQEKTARQIRDSAPNG